MGKDDAYGRFKALFAEGLAARLAEEGKHVEVVFRQVRKPDAQYEGALLKDVGERRGIASPLLDMGKLYQWYQRQGSIGRTVEAALFWLWSSASEAGPVAEARTGQECVVFELIPTAGNQGLLGDVPHRGFLDMSVVYRFVQEINEEYLETILVTNRVMEREGMTEEGLYGAAYVNTRRLFPPELCSRRLVQGDAPYPHVVELTNERGVMGAASLLYADTLALAGEEYGSDLYVFPVSSDYVLLVPTNEAKGSRGIPERFRKMGTGRMLSDKVYYYSRGEPGLRELPPA